MTRTGSIPLAAGSIIAGKYRLEKPLARGGMGSVWVAQHIALDEPVALKLINRSAHQYGEADARQQQDAEIRLQREAKSAARLRSPHIVQLLDYGVDRETPYIVMELLEGEHLGARLRRKGRLSLAAATSIAEQVAKALRRAHKAGIVHRDLKPDNIFLARIDDEEVVKLLDFGLVKAVRGTLSGETTQSDMLMGSLYYMSPEQSLGFKDIDHRSDLWSLGVILFEMITGSAPFSGASIVDVIMQIRSGPIPVPSEVAPDLPPELDEFFERALQRDPGHRFASARAMVTALSTLVRQLGSAAQRVGEHPAPDSQRITMEISASEFLEDIPGLLPPSEAASTSDSAPTERKVPSMLEAPSKQAAPMSHSLQLAPTSMVSRAASSPDIPVSPTAVAPPKPRRPASSQDVPVSPTAVAPVRSRRPSRLPPTLDSAPVGTAANPPQATPPPPLPPARANAASPPPRKAPAPPKVSASSKSSASPTAASTPASTRAPRFPPTLESPGAIEAFSSPQALVSSGAPAAPAKRKPPGESALSPDSLSIALAPLNEQMKEGLFSRILGGSTPAPPADATEAGSGFEGSKQPSATSVPAKPAAPLPPPEGSVAELIDQGFTALRKGNRERARQCWEEAWRHDPSNRALELNLRKLNAKDR
jgi:serine/threonine protein kinase